MALKKDPCEYLREEERERSFESIVWPHRNSKTLTPPRLAAAGFYAAPTPKAPDSVVCFACENALIVSIQTRKSDLSEANC